jgi:hypothetical protein
MRKKPAPDLIRGAKRFSARIPPQAITKVGNDENDEKTSREDST